MKRQTSEVDIEVLMGEGGKIETGDRVLTHLLQTFFFYMDRKVTVQAHGDLPHHLWEDIGITLGEEMASQIDRQQIARFGNSVMPMDDALVLTAVDISRPYLCFEVECRDNESGFSEVLVKEFLSAFTSTLPATIHVHRLSGKNSHHLLEAVFKALGASFKQALKSSNQIQSTKGDL